jgi:hypothetical protein
MSLIKPGSAKFSMIKIALVRFIAAITDRFGCF